MSRSFYVDPEFFVYNLNINGFTIAVSPETLKYFLLAISFSNHICFSLLKLVYLLQKAKVSVTNNNFLSLHPPNTNGVIVIK